MKDALTQFIERRHPLYEQLRAHWDFLESTYDGGREWFVPNIFRYEKEGDKGYTDRVARAYRFNHTKQVVDLVNKYLFRKPVQRRVDDADVKILNFWKRATLSGLDIDALMDRVASESSKYGRPYIIVDSTASFGGSMSVAEEKAADIRPYAYLVRPQDVLDMSYDDAGKFNWVKVREMHRRDSDPIHDDGGYNQRFRLWTREDWTLYEEQVIKGKTRIVEIDYGIHNLGVVPIVHADHNFTEEQFAAPGLIDDIAYLDRANANYLSNLDAIIQDQSFSQLVMPAQSLMPGEDGYEKLVAAGTKRVMLYNGDSGMAPAYISPDPRQASMILSAIGKIINEIYHSVGLAAERTKHDNGGGIDNSSGVAKAYDFEKVNSLLAAKATSLEKIENDIVDLVHLWAGVKPKAGVDRLVSYPMDFDIPGLVDELGISAQLSLLGAPDVMRQEQMRTAAAKLFPGASKELRDKIDASIDTWTPTKDAADVAAKALDAKQNAGPIKAASNQKTAKAMTA